MCPECGKALKSIERADYCDCGYECYYPDAYSEKEAYREHNGAIERMRDGN